MIMVNERDDDADDDDDDEEEEEKRETPNVIQEIIRLNDLQSSNNTHTSKRTNSGGSMTDTFHQISTNGSITSAAIISNGIYHHEVGDSMGNTNKLSSPSISTPEPVSAPIDDDTSAHKYHYDIIGVRNRYSIKNDNILKPPQSHPLNNNSNSVSAAKQEGSHTINVSSNNGMDKYINDTHTPTNGTLQSSYNDNSVAL